MMTIDQKRNCVEELLNELRSRLMSRLGDVPDEWEGGELRTWIADSARSMCVVLNAKRTRGYSEDVSSRHLMRSASAAH